MIVKENEYIKAKKAFNENDIDGFIEAIQATKNDNLKLLMLEMAEDNFEFWREVYNLEFKPNIFSNKFLIHKFVEENKDNFSELVMANLSDKVTNIEYMALLEAAAKNNNSNFISDLLNDKLIGGRQAIRVLIDCKSGITHKVIQNVSDYYIKTSMINEVVSYGEGMRDEILSDVLNDLKQDSLINTRYIESMCEFLRERYIGEEEAMNSKLFEEIFNKTSEEFRKNAFADFFSSLEKYIRDYENLENIAGIMDIFIKHCDRGGFLLRVDLDYLGEGKTQELLRDYFNKVKSSVLLEKIKNEVREGESSNKVLKL